MDNDEIIEAKNKTGEMYGIERLKTSLLQNAYRKADDVFNKVTDDFSKFLGVNHRQEDDITMIVIKNIGQHQENRKIVLSIKTGEDQVAVDTGKSWDWE